MSDIIAITEPDEFRAGWPVVLACFCTAVFAWGFGFYGQSVYFADLHATYGWPASLIASATTVYYLIGGLLLAYVHRAMARLGPRLLLASGAIVLGLGAIWLGHAQAPWQLYAAGIVMAIGWAATTTTAIATTLAHWFDRRRGLALSLALNGASAGGFIVTPILARIVHRLGLQQGVTLLVAIGLVILLPMILAGVGRVPSAVRPTQAGSAAGPDAEWLPAFANQAEVLRSARVWSIAAPFALALAAQVGFIVHQLAFLRPHLGNAGAANAVAATAFAAAAGRLAMAPVIDRMNQRVASAASFVSQAMGLALMLALPDQPAALYIGSIVFGLSVGNVITLPALIVQREFASQSFGLVIGLISMLGYTLLAFGPTLLGVARDATGGYGAALLLCIALQLTGAVVVLIRPRAIAGGRQVSKQE
jgi:MFS family permease